MFEIIVEGGKIIIPETYILKRSNEEETTKTFKLFERYLVKILSKEDSKIVVNWQEMERVIDIADYRAREAIRQYICSVLLSLNILTENPRGSYSFSDNNMNPDYGMPGRDFSSWRIGTVYFRRKEDIIAYGKARFAGTLYNWNIFRMTELIQKQEICK